MSREVRRRSPEEFLEQARQEEDRLRRGRLKMFLGYASGVGKSFRMLDEARQRRQRGQDLVVAAIQPSVPDDIRNVLAQLEVVPTRCTRGTECIDVDALLRRRPSVCVIDGLGYDNPPGARNPTRWMDADELMANGISVISTINIQYVHELLDKVEAITGKRATQTVPLAFLEGADEIELVDAPTEGPGTSAEQQERLSRLRELALVVAADVVDHQLNAYLQSEGIQYSYGTQERLLICLTPRANVTEMLETASIIAGRFHGSILAAWVEQPNLREADRLALEEKFHAARAAGATIHVLQGDDPTAAILQFAQDQGITQLFIGHSQRTGVKAWLRGNPVERLIRQSHGMDVRVFPQ